MGHLLRKFSKLLGASLLLLQASTLAGQAPIPIRDDFQVNTYTTGWQWFPSVAVAPDGSFLIAWQSEGSAGTDIDDYSIQVQRFDALGAPMGSQFQLNTYTTGAQAFPHAVVDESGNFIVMWQSEGSFESDTDSFSIQGRVVRPWAPQDSREFQVNSHTTGSQCCPAAASQGNGQFVVTWSGRGFGTDPDRSVQGRRFQSDGTSMGGEFRVNSYITGSQRNSQVASDAEGNFVVTWTSDGSYGSDNWKQSIQARRFSADATPLGSDFQVNTFTRDFQGASYVGASISGDFVVTWTSFYGINTTAWTIQAQRFDNEGEPQGPQFQVSNYTTQYQVTSPIAMRPNGEFVVVWHHYGRPPHTDSSGILGREFKAESTPLTDDFQVNSYTTHGQLNPAIALGPGGRFIVAWSSFRSPGTDDDRTSIQARILQSTWIFSDDFEQGNTSAWSWEE